MSKREMIHIRISSEQRESLKWKANKAEMSVSEFIRRRLGLEEGESGRPVEKVEGFAMPKKREKSVRDIKELLGECLVTAEELNKAYDPSQEVETILVDGDGNEKIDPLF